MTERDKILARIREALTVPAPPPEPQPDDGRESCGVRWQAERDTALAGDGQPRPKAVSALRSANALHTIFREPQSVATPTGKDRGEGEHVPILGSHSVPGTTGPSPAGVEARRWLPKVGASFEEQLALFAKNCADLKANFQAFAGWAELSAALIQLRDAERWRSVASHQAELSGRACEALNLPVCWTDRGCDALAMEQCDVGVTECDALIAQTGSVLVTSRSAGGRALSVLPPHHVVIARRAQLVPDLPAALALLQQKYAPEYPSMISFITGPSRTGDIERILVLGAHGPKKLTIFCV